MNKEVDSIIQQLSPNERAIIPYLHFNDVAKISEHSKLDETSIKRSLEYLANKNLVEIKMTFRKLVSLGDNGVLYLKHELPERRLLNALASEKDKKATLKESKEKSKLSDNEFSIALGVLKSKALITMSENVISLTAKEYEIGKKFPEEKFLEILPIEFEKLAEEQKYALDKLKSRKDIVRTEEIREIGYIITDLGKELLKQTEKIKEAAHLIETLTPEMIRSESWKGKQFRHYDITSKVPSVVGGKRQHYYGFLQEVRENLTSLGFEEAQGPLVESSFFNCDALFMPQDHPARGIHDLYFVKGTADLSKYKKIISEIKKVHENGGKTGSEGWKVPFSEKLSSELILRSQGTAISARILSSNPKIPGKYFAMARVYRPDIIDASHHTEFNQLEGIVIDKSLNFRNLLGLLKKFAEKMTGSKKIKFLPGYYPFTEPSVDCYVYHEKLKKWMELGGAGIFRPEVTLPLGIKDKVLAWGLGIDRFYMIRENITDIRQLFSTNLEVLRS